MNPHQMAKAQCDCYTDEGCLGITIKDNGSLVRFLPEGQPCLLIGIPKRCQHFEQCIMPRKPENKDSRIEAKLQAEWADGTHDYRMKTGAITGNRLCPDCQKRFIEPRRRCCDECGQKKRRESKQSYKASLKGTVKS